MNSTRNEDNACSISTKKIYLQGCLNLENEDVCKAKHDVGYCSMVKEEEMSKHDHCGYIYKSLCTYGQKQTVEKCLCEKKPSLNPNLNELSTMFCLCIHMDDEPDESKEKSSSCKTKGACQKTCVPQTSENTEEKIYKCTLNNVNSDSTLKQSHSLKKLSRKIRQLDGATKSINKTHIKDPTPTPTTPTNTAVTTTTTPTTTTTVTTTTTNTTTTTTTTTTFSRNQKNQSTISPSENNNPTTSTVKSKISSSSKTTTTKTPNDLNNTFLMLNSSSNQYPLCSNLKGDFHLQGECSNITQHKTTDPLKITMPILFPLIMLVLVLYYYYRRKRRRSNRVYIKRKLLSHKIKTVKINNKKSFNYESQNDLYGTNQFSGSYNYISLEKQNELLEKGFLDIKPGTAMPSLERMRKKMKENEDKVIEE